MTTAGRNEHLTPRNAGGRMRSMSMPLSVEEIVPLVAALPPEERARLLRAIRGLEGADSAAYMSTPPVDHEFSSDDDPLAWDGEGWEDIT